MNKGFSDIVKAIDNIYVKGSYYYSEYIFNKLKNEFTLKLIRQIINNSNKTPSEVVIILLAAIRYIQKDTNALLKLEQTDSFLSFIKDQYQNLLEISTNRKVQGNFPERGLPILEILGKKMPHATIGLIELGASYGLIGSCLLHSKMMLENKNIYFHANQKSPENPKNIDFYLGIDIDPPEQEWLLACYYPDEAKRIKSYISEIPRDNSFQLIKGSAVGFSLQKEIKEFILKEYKLVVLTSFLFYQLDDEKQKLLKDEISEFIYKNNGHWIRQEVELYGKQASPEYFVEWDGERIMELTDDKCSNWSWNNN